MAKIQRDLARAWEAFQKSDLGFLLLLTLLWAFFQQKVLWGGNAIVLDDASRQFFPQWAWEQRAWHSGCIPFWNPDEAFGNPNLANICLAAFYPPLRLLYHCLGLVEAFNACVVFHHLFLIVGFYFFIKGRNLSRPAAFLGAVTLGFSIHAIAAPFTPTLLMTFSWIPWIFWSSDRLWKDQRGSTVLLAFALAFQIAAGYPLLSFLTLLVLILEGLSRPEIREKVSWIKAWRFFAALSLAFLFNLVWILPFVEFLKLGNVSHRLAMQESMPLQALLTWLNPFYLSHPLHGGGELLFEFSSYFMGLPILGLLVWGLTSGKAKLVPFLLALLWIGLSLGGKPVELLDRLLPFYHWVTRSGYWMSLIVFTVALLAATIAHERLKIDGGNPGVDFKWAASGLLVYGGALLSVSSIPLDLSNFWVSFFLYLTAGLLKRTPPFLCWALLVGATFFSIWPAAQNVHFTLDRRYYEEPPPSVLEMTKPGRIYTSFQEVERFQKVSGSSVAESYGRLKNAMVSDWPLLYGKEECFLYGSFFLMDYYNWCFSSARFSESLSRKVLDYLNVRYVLGKHNFKGFKWLEKGNDGRFLSENEHPFPKWFSVHQALPQGDWIGDFWRTDRENLDLNRQCFVEDPTAEGFYSPRRVMEEERSPDRVVLRVQGKGRSLLVSSEMAYPGWTAFVDGKKVPLLRVNHGFRGVVLENDKQQLEMIFQPTTFRLGCFLALAASGLWAGLVLGSFLLQPAPIKRRPLA